MDKNQDISFGRTFRERFPQIKEETSRKLSKKSVLSKDIRLMLLDLKNGAVQDLSWQKISHSHGGYLMLHTSEYPREENVSFLSQILMDKVPEKYYLSKKACLGILRRAESRGKKLPDILKQALVMQSKDTV